MKIKTRQDAIDLFGDKTFKLIHILEGIITYKSCMPFQYEENLYYIEIEIFYENGSCLDYEEFYDLLRESPKVFTIKSIGGFDNETITLFERKYDQYKD
jgi:hypothetical protein